MPTSSPQEVAQRRASADLYTPPQYKLRSNSVVVGDVAIPPNLLRTAMVKDDWHPKMLQDQPLPDVTEEEEDEEALDAVPDMPQDSQYGQGSSALRSKLRAQSVSQPLSTVIEDSDAPPVPVIETAAAQGPDLAVIPESEVPEDITKGPDILVSPQPPARAVHVNSFFGNFTFGETGKETGNTPARVGWRDDVENTFGESAVPPIRRGTRQYSRMGSIAPQGRRRSTFASVANAIIPTPIQDAAVLARDRLRQASIYQTYEKAKVRGKKIQRQPWAQNLFEYIFYLILLCIVYFVLVGRPLWKGTVWWCYWVVRHKFVISGGWAVTIGIAAFYAFSPLLVLFEDYPPMPNHPPDFDLKANPGVADTALLIPCYKSEQLIGKTLEAALKVFPASHIFVIANGNSPTPLDKTEEVCRPYGVNHIWSPVGSKIVAQFVGAYAAKDFKNVLLIDDDCALPPNFPVVGDRLKGRVKCIGYTIKSVGPESSKGTYCQQAQDLEYKLSGLQRAFAGKIGSATFPHGAISIWDRELLIQTFHEHPGFSVSEDWFFGHVARQLGSRITMCTSVFVETETPDAIFFSSGGSRGGFGEMTIFKQRFMRWNFFFVNGMWYNLSYILFSWKLGWWEIGCKLFVFQEIYETLLYLTTPFILPISFIIRPAFCAYLFAATCGMYLINVILFNEIHLRRKNERIGWKVLWIYYLPYKIILTFVNVTSCYWAIWKYASYFARRHPKVIEDEKAVEVVLRLHEDAPAPPGRLSGSITGGRRMTVTAIEQRPSLSPSDPASGGGNSYKRRRSTLLPITEPDLTVPLPSRPRGSVSVGGRMHRLESIPDDAVLVPPSHSGVSTRQASRTSHVSLNSQAPPVTPSRNSSASSQVHNNVFSSPDATMATSDTSNEPRLSIGTLSMNSGTGDPAPMEPINEQSSREKRHEVGLITPSAERSDPFAGFVGFGSRPAGNRNGLGVLPDVESFRGSISGSSTTGIGRGSRVGSVDLTTRFSISGRGGSANNSRKNSAGNRSTSSSDGSRSVVASPMSENEPSITPQSSFELKHLMPGGGVGSLWSRRKGSDRKASSAKSMV